MRTRRFLPLAPVIAVLALTGCGSSATKDVTPAQRLAAPGATWAKLDTSDQRAALRTCRLDAAATAAERGGALTAAPLLSARYMAVERVDGVKLRSALTDWFAQPDHARQTVGDGCAVVLRGLIDLSGVDNEPHADFAAPVTTHRRGLRLAVAGDHITFRARLTPANAKLAITDAPGRSHSSARITVVRKGDQATITLSGLPHGISYHQVTVTAGGGRSTQLLVVRRHPAPRLPTPRTFAPMVISGQGSRGLPVLYLPRRGLATVQTQGAPLSLTSGGTVFLAHRLGDHDRQVPIDAGRYRDVQVTATGSWTITIIPAAGP